MSKKGILYELLRENGKIQWREVPVGEKRPARVFDYVSTPGHGYLKVKQNDIAALAIARDISECSYMSLNDVLLEEDCDMAVFIRAYLDSGQRFFCRQRHISGIDKNHGRYHPNWLNKRITLGTVITLNSKGVHAQIISMDKTTIRVIYQDANGNELTSRLNKRGFLSQIMVKPTHGYLVTHEQNGALLGMTGYHNGAPIWSNIADECPDEAKLFKTVEKAQAFLSEHGIGSEQVQIIPVDCDPWVNDWCNMVVANRAGVPAWTIGHKYRYPTVCTAKKVHEKGSSYTLWDCDAENSWVQHDICMPGKWVRIIDDARIVLPDWIKPFIVENPNDGEYYIHYDHLGRYIDVLDRHLGIGFYGYFSWQDNPLWAKDMPLSADVLEAA